MKERLCRPEVWCKIGLVFVFGAFYVLAIPYPAKAREFPQLLAGFSLLMTVISLGFDFGRKGAQEVVIGDVDDTELKPLDLGERKVKRVRFYKASAIIGVSTLFVSRAVASRTSITPAARATVLASSAGVLVVSTTFQRLT